MTNIRDLHIQEQVLRFFDFTHNDFSKETLLTILQTPLSCLEEVLLRQQIVKGFIANLGCLRNYAYSRVDLVEVHAFHHQYLEAQTSKRSLKLRLLLSEKERHQTRSRYVQFVLLFYKLQIHYLKLIDVTFFPESYKNELKAINEFFTSFNLSQYEQLIREQKFKIKHIVELASLLSWKASKGELTIFWKRYFLFEAYLSIGIGISKHHFCFPSFSETDLSFEDLYHPILPHPVKNSFTSKSNVFLLTGPNMSGKSTLLKAVGLSVYLGNIGLALPASKAEMPFFDTISISINLNDDIENGYSHFMTEVINLKKVLIEATNGRKCFAVFDELFRGTNIEDAIDISSSTIKGLARFSNSFFFISTHLHQLKELEEVQSGKLDTWFVDCAIINASPIFTYVLKYGWSDLKVGRILFEKEGLNELLNDSSVNGDE